MEIPRLTDRDQVAVSWLRFYVVKNLGNYRLRH